MFKNFAFRNNDTCCQSLFEVFPLCPMYRDFLVLNQNLLRDEGIFKVFRLSFLDLKYACGSSSFTKQAFKKKNNV